MEQRMKYAEFVKEWNMKREDLECEDLKVISLFVLRYECVT